MVADTDRLEYIEQWVRENKLLNPPGFPNVSDYRNTLLNEIEWVKEQTSLDTLKENET